jgi:hypothetical protein
MESGFRANEHHLLSKIPGKYFSKFAQFMLTMPKFHGMIASQKYGGLNGYSSTS